MSKIDCLDHPGEDCRQQNPHIPATPGKRILIASGKTGREITIGATKAHFHCEWCGFCKDCHPHECYHLGDPCERCGTTVAERPLPVFRDHRGMCQPPTR